MKKENEFLLDLLRLTNKTHEFEYSLNDEYFASFDQELIENGTIKVHLEVDKGDALVELRFKINGYITLECDRSLEKFNFPISFEKTIYLKYGEEFLELDDYYFKIPANSHTFYLKDLLFDLIALQIPAKNIHPSFKNEHDDNEEDVVLFFSTQTEEEESESEDIDPRWKELLNLKNKNN